MSPQRILSLIGVALACASSTPRVVDAQVGRGCSFLNQCSRGYSCQPIIQKCYHSPRREGEPCSAGYSCGSGLRCAAGVQRCVKQNAGPTGVIEQGANAVGQAAIQGATAVGNAATGAVASMSCPDMQMKCPTGQGFARGTSWDPGRAMCRPSNSMATVLANKCPNPYAGDSRTTRRGTPLSSEWTRVASQPVACSAKTDDINIEAQYSELFNDACVVHDLCYRSAKTKSSCDADFLYNMQAVCYKLDVLMAATAGGTVAACLTAANAGYAGVVAKGQDSYDGDQKDFGYPAGGAPVQPAPPPPSSYPPPGGTRPVAFNVALNKPTQQSSTAFGGMSSRAVDGNTDGAFFSNSVTHSDLDSGAWWMVDLGAEYLIESVTVFNRTVCCGERLNAVVAVAAAPGWPSSALRFQRSLGAPQGVMSVPVSSGGSAVYGRYVFVVNGGRNYLSMAEVQVMGVPR